MSRRLVVKTSLLLPNHQGDLMSVDVRFPDSGGHLPVVVICHSFMAFKDWGFFPYVAEELARAGMVSVTFNFSHNGVVGDGNRITDFSRFERNTFTQELDDLGALLDGLCVPGGLPPAVDAGKMALLGHSRGGGLAIVRGSLDERVSAVVSWSAIATFDRWTPHQKAAWRATGHLPLAKNSTVSPLRLGLDLLNDVEAHREALDIVGSGSRLGKPWLIVHGREDLTVPVREAEALYAASEKSSTELQLLDHVGHLYNAASSAEDGYRTLDSVIGVSSQWLLRTLSHERNACNRPT